MHAPTQAEREEYERRVAELMAEGARLYGTPPGSRAQANSERALRDLDMHAFRLTELPMMTGDASLAGRPLRFLDFGCGHGPATFQALARGHDAWGIDLGESRIALARAWAPLLGHPQWAERTLVADGTRLPFADASFDVVSSFNVIEHIPDLVSALYEAVRVTKRGGYLELGAPDYRMSYEPHYQMPWPRFMPPDQAAHWVAAMGRPAAGLGSFFYITAPQVAALLEALGCRLIRLILSEDLGEAGGRPFPGTPVPEPIVFGASTEIGAVAQELRRLEAEGRLPEQYRSSLSFRLVAQRM